MNIDRATECIGIARELFEEVAAWMMPVRSRIDIEPIPQLALALEFEVQPGLAFPISANLQNVDELHLNIGSVFWHEWFPCYDPSVAAAFREAIQGVLSGEYRVVEYYRESRPIKAELQRPEKSEWKTIALSTSLRLPSFRKAENRIVQTSKIDTLS